MHICFTAKAMFVPIYFKILESITNKQNNSTELRMKLDNNKFPKCKDKLKIFIYFVIKCA